MCNCDAIVKSNPGNETLYLDKEPFFMNILPLFRNGGEKSPANLDNVIQEVRIEVNKKPLNIFQCSTVLKPNCHNWYTCFSMFNGFKF